MRRLTPFLLAVLLAACTPGMQEPPSTVRIDGETIVGIEEQCLP